MRLADAIRPVLDTLPRLPAVILVGGTTIPRAHAFENSSPSGTKPVTADTLSDEVAFWLYTSGSTGDPKGVKHVHSNLMATAKLFGQGILGITENDVVHSASKLFFAYGLGNALTFPLRSAPPPCCGRIGPRRKACSRSCACTGRPFSTACPRSTPRCSRTRTSARARGSDRLRLCVSAGEALPAHIGERWREVTGVDVLDGLGSTEMLNTFLSNRPGDIRYGSTGRPVPGYEARIVDEHGRELGADEIGELIVRGPSAGEGYWNQRGKAAAPSPASGPTPATSTGATPTATSITAGAPTTCSRSPACGCRRSTSRPRWSRTRRCSRPPSSARKTPTG